MHFELRCIEEHRELSVLSNLEYLAFVTAPGPQRAVLPGHDGPEEWRCGFTEERRRRPRKHAAIAVDREIFHVSFQEVGLSGNGPERRGRRRQRYTHDGRDHY